MSDILQFIKPSPECFKLMLHHAYFVILLLMFGAIGGIARGAYERLTSGIKMPNEYDYDDKLYKNRRRNFWIQHIFLGIAGGATAMMLALLLSKYNLDIKKLSDIILYSVISIFGGVMAKRCLPVLEDVTAKKLGELDKKTRDARNEAANAKNEAANAKNEAANARNEADNEKNEAANVMLYTQLISDADTALRKPYKEREISYVQDAIKNMEKAESTYYCDRHFIIKLGRLYRGRYELLGNVSDLDKAIIILRRFIEYVNNKKKISQNDLRNKAVALFNVACYHSIKMDASPYDRERLKQEGIQALKEAISLYNELDVSDPDLNNLDFYDKKSIDNETKT